MLIVRPSSSAMSALVSLADEHQEPLLARGEFRGLGLCMAAGEICLEHFRGDEDLVTVSGSHGMEQESRAVSLE